MKRITGIFLLAAALAAGASCKKEQLAITYSNQEARIDKYIESEVGKDPAITVTYNGGASRMTRVQGEGAALSADGHVSFNIYVQSQYQITRMPIFAMVRVSCSEKSLQCKQIEVDIIPKKKTGDNKAAMRQGRRLETSLTRNTH